jgi:hypothetical protein
LLTYFAFDVFQHHLVCLIFTTLVVITRKAVLGGTNVRVGQIKSSPAFAFVKFVRLFSFFLGMLVRRARVNVLQGLDKSGAETSLSLMAI